VGLPVQRVAQLLTEIGYALQRNAG
jgi:hypothetical protein